MLDSNSAFSLGESVPVPCPKKKQIDRHEVARLLAEGRPVGEVAEAVGCTRQHVWRLMRKSRLLARAVADAEYELGAECTGRLDALRPAVAETLVQQLHAGNVRVLLWLADQLEFGKTSYVDARKHARDVA
jgi:hypothetical protein